MWPSKIGEGGKRTRYSHSLIASLPRVGREGITRCLRIEGKGEDTPRTGYQEPL